MRKQRHREVISQGHLTEVVSPIASCVLWRGCWKRGHMFVWRCPWPRSQQILLESQRLKVPLFDTVSAASLRHREGGVLTSAVSKNRAKREWKIPTRTAKSTNQSGMEKEWGFGNQVEGKERQPESFGTQGSCEWGTEPICPQWTFI